MLETARLSLGILSVTAQEEAAEEEAPTWDPAMRAAVPGFVPGEPYADSARLFQGIPGLERAPGGRLWATWYSGGVTEGPENYVVLVTSTDDGQTWSAPELVIDPPGNVRAFDPCLWLDPRGRLWLFYAQSYSWYDGRAGVWAMVTEQPDAAHPVWSAPERLCDGIMMNKPIATEQGDWLLPAAVWGFSARGLMDQEFRRSPLSFPATNVVASVDHGALWELRGQAHVPQRACDEHMLVERRDGSLWMLVRTSYGIGESFSTDGGATWTPGAKAATVGHIPAARFFIRRLHSGRLLLVKHDPPNGRSRSHLTAFLSDDDGQTWRGGLQLDARDGVSYPDGCQANDGRIYLVYDYQRTRERQILMAVFTEDDVLDQRFSSPGARDRALINQATGQREPD